MRENYFFWWLVGIVEKNLKMWILQITSFQFIPFSTVSLDIGN
jgi:hypothetical protein